MAGRHGDEVQVWDDIKAAATDVLHRHRATITHHHTVGRDHRPAYDLQHSEPFALALRAAKNSLDPHHIPNPGFCPADRPARGKRAPRRLIRRRRKPPRGHRRGRIRCRAGRGP
ncbi:FAD-linked oxidase C-terminal domain-containing protein [Streptomyces mirabilis]|uniref:FAD-linked oxidase C-terminal domain-containing protein n=1 Tax=Streptomyces mirabilis TaxID=68239 RepID=UPI002E2054EC|nr:FAD-linked oxidase C-terminal domain-containing protein [Streptomyces mirabilis]